MLEVLAELGREDRRSSLLLVKSEKIEAVFKGQILDVLHRPKW